MNNIIAEEMNNTNSVAMLRWNIRSIFIISQIARMQITVKNSTKLASITEKTLRIIELGRFCSCRNSDI